MHCPKCEGRREQKCTPPAVIKVDGGEHYILFRRVDVPAIMGDDTEVPASNGLYKNVLLVYLANDHVYLYDSEGIPTRLK